MERTYQKLAKFSRYNVSMEFLDSPNQTREWIDGRKLRSLSLFSAVLTDLYAVGR